MESEQLFRLFNMTPEHLRTIAVLSVASLAVAFDVRTRRIPNVLNFGAALAALGFAFLDAGVPGTMTAAGAWLVGVGLFLPFFALGGMGGGDVKLLAALAAWLGPMDAVYLAVFTSLAGGVAAAGVAIARGHGRQALSNIWLMLMHWRVVGPKPVPGLTLQDGRAPRLAYAIPIAVGALCTLWRH
jgi:prepilin peptidase CpaA